MCGIIGYYGKKKFFFRKKKAIQTILHRGPDSNKFLEIEDKKKKINLFIGFSRLSIQDTKQRSNQPFRYKNLILSFNGEIYNFIKLKKILSNEGINFYTTSDTEVLIKLIYYKGLKETLNLIEGMWAFVLYDLSNQEIFLCRDRFGEKPLLYFKEKKYFFFGSELPVFKFFLKKKLQINKNYLKKYLFLNYRYLNQNFETFYKNVMKIPPGNYIKFDKNLNETIFNYHKVKQKRELKISYKKVVGQIKKILIELTAQSMTSDRPLAFCLSGGIDSTGLVSIAKKKLKKKINTFTIFTDDKKYDEFRMVNKTIKNLNIQHQWIKINKKDSLDNLIKILKQRLTPISTVTYYIQWLMFKKISELGFKVVISGNGSDEIFSGYYDHHLAYLADVKNNKTIYKESLLNWKKNIKPLIRNNMLKDVKIYSKRKNYLKIIKGINLSSVFGKKKFLYKFKEKKVSNSLLKNRMINEMFSESVPVNIQEEDLNAMSFSMENRSPYLNSKLYDFFLKMPVKYFVKDGYSKSILRESLKNIAPSHILKNYEKIGFNISPDKLFDFKSKKIIQFIKKKSDIFNIVSKKKILFILNDKNNIKKYSDFIFKFINVKVLLDYK